MTDRPTAPYGVFILMILSALFWVGVGAWLLF